MDRRKTRMISVGGVTIGGNAPIRVQSMTNTITSDIDATVRQILQFEEAGCDISRSAINSLEDAKAIPKIKERTNIPLIADIQFDHRLALYAIEYDCDGLRINPGNIGGEDRLREIVSAAKKKRIPIRVGVNSGSVHQDMIEKYHGVNVESLVYSALEEVSQIERFGYDQIKVAIKSSSVPTMIAANRLFSEKSDYPLHLGVTEAGLPFAGTIKSAVGIGTLLAEGIGDTLRVSITGDPVQEVKIGVEILKDLGLRKEGVDLVSCPTCARTKIDLIGIAEKAEHRLRGMKKNLHVAIMGCPVNGPGEAREADIGIAGNNGSGVIFKKGKVIRQVPEEKLLDALIEEIEKMQQ
ncbi:MAG: flavodoxin-dependent (E)-4-hydroxy-3-methylbut-2-enyl-diphosphate synthase [Peptoniphilaceae bacterium]|nr:flavodoxin-dependent (E)-4-hydroxy-3-methylbut-2-enyl-diphosphate synthase [Peptoniphilaceae bacterium]MDY3076025.1 flavodoxin-dependent (E)-4-hydroxy-3-methylbut-2-enyl-diphosphate synthase [Peptoniphilaceae bacterium]MDY4196847.1 flavodoxin-dependent (E)-4-hydroxy-3-methylbut-2-enyl-diphosphate synthase [Peptoniphilaceae bacterium]MDY5841641.1 flavodoxin-dependent (E)-4-hydroxy-3-methylbut-2-enyl-diphosphate synthase [Peptoniphilaceae bacterium]MDY6146084.1 flavodoxin-dependent (E)-4-hydro